MGPVSALIYFRIIIYEAYQFDAQDYLTVPILDSFSNFLLTPSLNEAAMEKVFAIIPSMSFQEIPAAVKVIPVIVVKSLTMRIAESDH